MREVRSMLVVSLAIALLGHIVGAQEPQLSPVYDPVVQVVPTATQSTPPVIPFTIGPKVTLPRTEKHTPIKTPAPAQKTPRKVLRTQYGVASVYWEPQGTSTGGWYDGSGYVAAHREAPVGSILLVTALNTGLSKHIVVCDHGPKKIYDRKFGAYRIIDISPATARVIGLPGKGVDRLGLVKVEWIWRK